LCQRYPWNRFCIFCQLIVNEDGDLAEHQTKIKEITRPKISYPQYENILSRFQSVRVIAARKCPISQAIHDSNANFFCPGIQTRFIDPLRVWMGRFWFAIGMEVRWIAFKPVWSAIVAHVKCPVKFSRKVARAIAFDLFWLP
jgi:hypothetical protein